jgi:hypothetical protein
MKLLINEKGSSSILVVLAFLMLGIFSVLGMMSSYSDYKLARKNAEWTQEYYSLEAQAQAFVSEVDGLLIENQGADSIALRNAFMAFDPQVILKESEDGLMALKVLEGVSGKKMRIEIELLSGSEKRYRITTLKEEPEIFEYEDELEYKELEVTGS